MTIRQESSSAAALDAVSEDDDDDVVVRSSLEGVKNKKRDHHPLPAVSSMNRQLSGDDENLLVSEEDVEEQEGMTDGEFVRGRSAIQYVDRDYPVPTKRLGHLMALLPLTGIEDDERTLSEFRVYVEVSAFLAFKQFQHRSDQILIDLPDMLEGCDFTWTYEHHDTQFSPLEAARALSEVRWFTNNAAENRPSSSSSSTTAVVESSPGQDTGGDIGGGTTLMINNTLDNTASSSEAHQTHVNSSSHPNTTLFDDEPENDIPPFRQQAIIPIPQHQEQNTTRRPFAILGAARSTVSQTLGILGSALELPQISSSSTASSLDESPYFARTVPTNDGDAHALMAYLHHLEITHVAVLFLNDSWGRRYEQDIQEFASIYGIHVESVAYQDEEHLDQALDQLGAYGLRYFIGLISSSNWKPVVRKAYEKQLIGNPEHQWFFGDLVELVGDSFTLDRETEWDIADALHGVGVLFLRVTPHEPFDRMLASFADDRWLQEEFIASHAEPHLLENFTFEPLVGRSLFQYLTFDAVIALGLTACNTPGLFTGSQFYRNLLEVDFEGVSGRVNLHPQTGTRIADSFQFQIVNLVVNDSKISPDIYFFHDPTAVIDLSPPLQESHSSGTIIEEIAPFIYQNNSTEPPMQLPELDHDMNLIPSGVRYFGISLSVFIIALCIACSVGTYFYRNVYVIRASQPIFLYQLCVGCLILVSAIIPMSFQEDMPGLDVACRTTPWLICVGFTVAISALFSKAHRINKLMRSGTSFRRVQVKPADVIKTFLILISLNLAILTGWTVSPYSMAWRRTYEDNYDEYDRSVESFGMCRPGGSSETYLFFLVPLLLLNLAILILTTVASYKGRNLPTEFSETTYLALSMIGITETCFLGGTTIVTTFNQPTAFFLVSALMIFIFCLSILLPVFLPKYKHRNAQEPHGRAGNIINVNRKARSSISQLIQESSESAHQSSELDGSSARRKSGNVASFFASSPQPVIVRETDSLGASSFHTRGSGVRRGSKARGSHSHISGLNLNNNTSYHRSKSNVRASNREGELAKERDKRRASDPMNNSSKSNNSQRRRATFAQGGIGGGESSS